MSQYVVDLALVVGDSCRHPSSSVGVCEHGLHGEDFYADVYDPAAIEEEMLDEEIVGDESILSKLDLDGHLVLDEVRLL